MGFSLFLDYAYVTSDQILTLREVSQLLKVSPKTVYRWVAAKKLRAARMGRKTYRVLEKDLTLFINRHLG